jgi:hypothetical protein
MSSWNPFKKDNEFKKDDPSKLTVRGKYLISGINNEELIDRKKEMINDLITTGYYIIRLPILTSEDLLNSNIFNFRKQSLTDRHLKPKFSDKFGSLLFGREPNERAYFRILEGTRDDLPVDITVRFTPTMNSEDKNKTDYNIEIVIFPCKYVKYGQLGEYQAKFKIDDLIFCSTPSIEMAKNIGASLKAEEIQEPGVVRKCEQKNQIQIEVPPEIVKSLNDFKKVHSTSKKIGFILMPFDKSPINEKILKTIKMILEENDYVGVRADDRVFHDAVLYNILTYLHGCDFGIAVFDKSDITTFNPNISFEVGFLIALNKPVFLLKDKKLTTLQSDLAGKLYSEFDLQDIENTISPMLKKWLLDKVY